MSMMKHFRAVVENILSCVKKNPNSPILRFNHEFISIMVNKGRIHRELGNFFGCTQNSVKSDDELR